jgi:HD-like signal output (HDOD) protein/CheY-like chemotaxis protein
MVADPNTLKFIESLESLPSLPTVASRVAGETQGESASVKEISDLIEKDMALTAKILQVVNSSLYGFTREIDSVEDAVGLMGFKQVGNLALGISVVSSFPHKEVYGFSYSDFWERSVGNAVAATVTAGHLKSFSDNSLFTTALLQDIGTCVLVRHAPLAYGNAIGMAKERDIHAIHTEREVLGTDHAEVGAFLAEQWNLPQTLQKAIRHHHFTEFGQDLHEDIGLNGESTTVKVINLANLMTDVMFEEDGESKMGSLADRARAQLGLDQKQIDTILDKLPEEISAIRSLFTVEEGEEEEESHSHEFFDDCPKCGSDSHIRFCGECGTSLVVGSTEVPSGGAKDYKVLVAEDSEAIRTAIVTLLKKRGFSVVVAMNGEEAVKFAGMEDPDLILMDIRMPVLDGLGALQKMRQDVRTQTTPVIMLTSVTSLDTVTEAIGYGATDYVAKPFTIKKLLGTIEKYTIHAGQSADSAEETQEA